MNKIPITRNIEFIYRKGSFCWYDQPLETFAQAFTAYFLIKRQDLKTARTWLLEQSIDKDYFQAAGWLWVLGEYLSQAPDETLPAEIQTTIQVAVEQVTSGWQQPRPNWFYQREIGVYTTNIAMAYGALQAINHTLKDEKINQTTLAIKNFLFSDLMQVGRVRSRTGDDEVYADIGLMAIPFGYLDAGNQILVGSVNLVEQHLISRGVHFRKGDQYYGGCSIHELGGLLAWYYAERGILDRARSLLGKVQAAWDERGYLPSLDVSTAWVPALLDYWRQTDDRPLQASPLAMVLFAIAELSISSKQTVSSDSEGSIQMIHRPTGYGHPYRPENCERYPRHPLAGEEVYLHVQTQPCRPEQQVSVQWSVNGQATGSSPMLLQKNAIGEQYWQVSIGAFPAGSKVQYFFTAADETGTATSMSFAMTVRHWQALTATSCTADETSKQLIFQHANWSGSQLILTLHHLREDTWQWRYAIEPVGQNFGRADPIADWINQLQIGQPRFYDDATEAIAEVLLEGDRPCALKVRFALDTGEQIYGLGERFSTIAYRGREVDQFVFNQYRDQEMKTYIPIPLAVSSHQYGLFLDTDLPSVFRIGSGLVDLLEIEVEIDEEHTTLDTYVFSGKPANVLQAYVRQFGSPVLPPKWAFGPWISSNNWDRQAEVMRQLALSEEHQIPATVMVLEQWSDEATYYIFNDAQYDVQPQRESFELADFQFPAWGRWPDPKQMVGKIHADGLKLLLWQPPIQKYMDGIPHAQRDLDEQTMLERGYAVMRQNGEAYRVPPFEWFKNSSVPDFTNPAARRWWLEKRRYLLDELEIDGFKTDGGECIYGDDTVFANGLSGRAMHNRFPVDYIKSFYDYTQQHRPEGGITFSRAGYAGIQKYPLVWAGDERSTYKAFRDSIRAGLNCGLSGIPFWGWDLGGFNGDIPTAELFIRSAQMAAFCPVMQYHAETKGQFNQDRTPWNIAERTGHPEVIALYRRFANWRMNLLPYTYQQAQISSRTGLPMMRAMLLSYPDDPRCQLLDDQYFFGDNLLVAPLVYEKQSLRSVYLPNGNWFDFFTGEQLAGSRRLKCSADWQELPVFVKDGSLIPLNLADSLQFGSFVGNALDRYQQLAFKLLTTQDLDWQFTDDLGNLIDFSVRIMDTGYRIKVVSAQKQTITLLIPAQATPANVELPQETLPEADSFNSLVSLSAGYAQEGGWSACRLQAGPDGSEIYIGFGS